MEETWKPICGFEGLYCVSNLGNVKSLTFVDKSGKRRNGTIRKSKTNNRGYHQMSLHKDGKTYYSLLHRLVALAFIPNPQGLPQVNHKDEDKNNNSVENLEWCDNSYNRKYGTGIERMAANRDHKTISMKVARKLSSGSVIQYSEDGNPIKQWISATTAEKATGICHAQILDCCRGKRKQAHGFLWKYNVKQA